MNERERLTKRDEFGNADIIGVSSPDLQLNLNFAEINRVTNALNKLADYEDAEERGLIVHLPCKVGDTVYELQGDGTIQKWFAYGITKYDGQEWAVQVKNNKNKWKYVDRTFGFNRFGKTVFLTREDAEKALKEVRENDR